MSANPLAGTWLDGVGGAEGLLRVFRGVPDASEVVLREASLQDGRRLALRFDLPRFPDRPPAKWTARGANTVQVALLLVGLRYARIEGTALDARLRLSLAPVAGGSVLTMAGDVSIRAEAEGAVVTDMSAYLLAP